MRMSSLSRPSWHRQFRPFGAIVVAGLLGACTGAIGDSSGRAGSTGTGATTGTGTMATGTGMTATGTTGTTTTTGVGGTTGGPAICPDQGIHAGRSPLRRLTRFEYNNTVGDVFGDATQPANALPPEEISNGFGNDADAQSVSSLLAEQYGSVAEGIATRATASAAALAKLAPCASSVTAATEEACARTIIENAIPRLYRRPIATGEADDLLALERTTRMT